MAAVKSEPPRPRVIVSPVLVDAMKPVTIGSGLAPSAPWLRGKSRERAALKVASLKGRALP